MEPKTKTEARDNSQGTAKDAYTKRARFTLNELLRGSVHVGELVTLVGDIEDGDAVGREIHSGIAK